MSGGVWLKCDNCNKDLGVTAAAGMQLAIRFKPSLFRRALDQLHPAEHRHRCRSCGWVNVFIPATAADTAVLTPSWRDISLKS